MDGDPLNFSSLNFSRVLDWIDGTWHKAKLMNKI